MINDAVETLNPETGERKVYSVPGGKDYEADVFPTKGPHSIEPDAEGNMWLTLALSGEMAMFDPKTEEWTVVSSAPAPRVNAASIHTRCESIVNGIVWYTDAGTNSVFALDPSNDNEVKQYNLLSADQAIGTGKGESSGITPYGISIAPDGKIWYSKLNAHRIGRIDPAVEDGDIKEWVPPFSGPRRLHVAKDGLVWVPFFGDGKFGSFDPETETWKCYDMPRGSDEIPYALNIHPQTGHIWVCGTGSDTLVEFIPDTEEMIEYRMPSQVTYTREVEFTADGSVWVCNSNYPARHIEGGYGSVIRIKTASNDAAAPLSGD
jgi:streptogramin lyase